MLAKGLLPIALVGCFLSLASPALGQQVTTGSIEGMVTEANGAPLPGATVTVTSKEGPKTETTDANGAFRFPYLAPGVYRLTVRLSGYNTVEHTKVTVTLGARSRIEASLSPTLTERIEVVGASPTIDVSSSTVGTTLTADVLSTLPVNRTFASTLGLAPGVVLGGLDQSNPSINGSSSLENTVYIDGVNIADTGYGSVGSFSYTFGPLGTGVNFDYLQEIQVKTGGYEPEYGETLGGYVNVVTKSGGNEFQGGAFYYAQSSGLEADRAATERNNAQFDLRGVESQDFGFDLGGPIVRDKAFWYGAFNPTFRTTTHRTPKATREAFGFDHTLAAERSIYNYAVNLKWLVSPKHTLSISGFGDPSVGDQGPQRAATVVSPDPTRKFSEIRFGSHNAIARWDGELLPNWFAEGSIAYHWDRIEETPAVGEPAGTDFRTEVPRSHGGVGGQSDNKSTNLQYQLKLSNFVRAGGEHHIRYGIQYQDIAFDQTVRLSGAPIVLPDTIAGVRVGGVSTTGFGWSIPEANAFEVGTYGSETLRKSRADYVAFFLSDSWSPIRSLQLMAGIRYEQETLEGPASDFTWDQNWAPRAHVTWDPTQDKRSKVAFAFGRFYGKVPNDLAVRAFGNELLHYIRYPISNVDTTDFNNPRIIDPNAIVDSLSFSFGTAGVRVDENAKLTYQDEYVLSAEREVLPFWKLAASYLHRRLGRTLEDVQVEGSYSGILAGTEPFGEYFITNPTPALGSPEPSRKYNAVTVSMEKRANPTGEGSAIDNVQLFTAYTWSRLEGNYEGYYRRENGQADPFITSLFDFPYLRDPDIFRYLIEDGVLPNDRAHVFNCHGSYRFPFRLTLGTSVKVFSGNPITKLGYNQVYATPGEIALEERGASGRTPTIYDFGLHASYPLDLRRSGRIHLILNVFNVLNHQKALEVEQRIELTGSGDVNPDFGKTTKFQDPLQVQLAARYAY